MGVLGEEPLGGEGKASDWMPEWSSVEGVDGLVNVWVEEWECALWSDVGRRYIK